MPLETGDERGFVSGHIYDKRAVNGLIYSIISFYEWNGRYTIECRGFGRKAEVEFVFSENSMLTQEEIIAHHEKLLLDTFKKVVPELN